MADQRSVETHRLQVFLIKWTPSVHDLRRELFYKILKVSAQEQQHIPHLLLIQRKMMSSRAAEVRNQVREAFIKH